MPSVLSKIKARCDVRLCRCPVHRHMARHKWMERRLLRARLREYFRRYDDA